MHPDRGRQDFTFFSSNIAFKDSSGDSKKGQTFKAACFKKITHAMRFSQRIYPSFSEDIISQFLVYQTPVLGALSSSVCI